MIENNVFSRQRPARIEQHTIYQIPLDQRHGKARHLFTLWVGANINVLTVVTGALATTLFGQSFLAGSTAIIIGNLIGTVFMALHAAQGPRLGVPQMVQSRGQFGAQGAAFVCDGRGEGGHSQSSWSANQSLMSASFPLRGDMLLACG